MAGQILLASTVIDWKKNKAHRASMNHWSIPSLMLWYVIHSLERQYECTWWINVLWVNLDVTVSSHCAFYDPHLSDWCEYVKYEPLLKKRSVYTSNDHGKNLRGELDATVKFSNTSQQKNPDAFVFIPVLFRAYFMIVDAWFRILGGYLKKAV